MSERQIKEYYERIEKLLNGANKETYGFAPQEIKNILRSYEELQKENQSLKKQLEEADLELQLLDMITDENIKYKNQQKEFIDYLEKMWKETQDIWYIKILQKYKEIIGSDSNE